MRSKMIAVLLVAVLAVALLGMQMTGMFVAEGIVLVERVIDGDTIVIEGGERVRLLGIDTPEKGQKYSLEATRFLENKVLNKYVKLESDVEDKDKYDRLLRWIFVGDDFVNLDLVKEGHAKTLFYADVKYRTILSEAEIGAMARGLGVWNPGNNPDMFCLGINWFQSNAPGDDRTNLNEEYVRFRNGCTETIDINGWKLQDGSGKEYVFSSVIGPKSMLTLHTGKGENNSTDAYWGLGNAIWNNNGDNLTVWNTKGEQILSYQY